MLLLISPAKTMKYVEPNPKTKYTLPHFSDEIKMLIQVLQKQKVKSLMQLMDISSKLAEQNAVRNAQFDFTFPIEHSSPALLSFAGDVYLGMNAHDFTSKELEFANQHIAILSGLYGLLKPLDLIQAYRLEMSTSLKVGKHKNLYDFWGDKIINHIKHLLKEHQSKIIINLASDEYFNAVKPYLNGQAVININFKELKSGKWTFISFNAKKARGLVCRYIVKHKIKNVANIKSFDYDDYKFNPEFSTEHEWVFTRKFIPIAEKKLQ